MTTLLTILLVFLASFLVSMLVGVITHISVRKRVIAGKLNPPDAADIVMGAIIIAFVAVFALTMLALQLSK